jgi:hypothetical protein
VFQKGFLILITDFVTHQPTAGETNIIRQLLNLAGSSQAPPGGLNHDQHGIHKIHCRPPEMFYPGIHIQDEHFVFSEQQVSEKGLEYG